MRKVLFVSLGCDKNLVDSEYMLGNLSKKGYVITGDEEDADVIVINTCAFIRDAQEESVETILEMTRLKETGSCRALIVAGCLAQSYKDEILKTLPQVDAVIGTTSFSELRDVIDDVFSGKRKICVYEPDRSKGLSLFERETSCRVITTGGHFEYLKIAEGCDKRCTYCSIPFLRGPYRSVPMENLVEEARYLADCGVVELNIVAQETTLYGVDVYGKKSLHILLERLCEIAGLHWIRILYCYPEEIYPELVQTIRTQPKICSYLDIPIQHCSDEILKKMGRRTTKSDLISTVRGLREEIPDIVLRTTLITGFPGERKEQHEELLEFINEMRFDRLGVFAYSRQDGTSAAEMTPQIDEDTKNKRRDEIMILQQKISAENNRRFEGKIFEVFVEGYMPDEGVYAGRTYADAPEVDGLLFFKSERDLESGMFVKCRVTKASEYDLLGEII